MNNVICFVNTTLHCINILFRDTVKCSIFQILDIIRILDAVMASDCKRDGCKIDSGPG